VGGDDRANAAHRQKTRCREGLRANSVPRNFQTRSEAGNQRCCFANHAMTQQKNERNRPRNSNFHCHYNVAFIPRFHANKNSVGSTGIKSKSTNFRRFRCQHFGNAKA